MMCIAAADAPEWHQSRDHLAAKLDLWVAEAVVRGANLLAFPEYGGVKAALIGPRQTAPAEA